MSKERTTGWDPDRYRVFAAERRQPFDDLLAMVEPVPGGRVIDLGCGTGELTAELHRATGAAETVGLDSSPEMLAKAAPHAGGGLTFELGDLATFGGTWHVVFANAALQWVQGHEALLARITDRIEPGGQLAFQVPANRSHPSHWLIDEIAATEPFAAEFPDGPPIDSVTSVLEPDRYAELLHDLGYERPHVRLQVYGHVLTDTAAVVDWTSGTALVRIRKALPPALYDEFVARYRARIIEVVGDRRPYFYAFRRILVSAFRPA